jgi:hypothetical protein
MRAEKVRERAAGRREEGGRQLAPVQEIHAVTLSHAQAER